MNTNPTNEHREQAREIVDRFRHGYPPIQNVRFLEWEPLVERFAAALSSRDAEIREVLEGLMTRRWFGDKPTVCWCDPRAYPDSDDDEDQDARCRRTRALYAKLQPGKEDE